MTTTEVYARALSLCPKAVAISVMAGSQTQDDKSILVWWSVSIYSTPIGKDSRVMARGEGDTPEQALDMVVKKYKEAIHGISEESLAEIKYYSQRPEELKEGE